MFLQIRNVDTLKIYMKTNLSRSQINLFFYKLMIIHSQNFILTENFYLKTKEN